MINYDGLPVRKWLWFVRDDAVETTSLLLHVHQLKIPEKLLRLLNFLPPHTVLPAARR